MKSWNVHVTETTYEALHVLCQQQHTTVRLDKWSLSTQLSNASCWNSQYTTHVNHTAVEMTLTTTHHANKHNTTFIAGENDQQVDKAHNKSFTEITQCNNSWKKTRCTTTWSMTQWFNVSFWIDHPSSAHK